ncbi:MAG: hypothetical protein FWG25_03175 [Promicromonosporaceae bacterium]|nr:hypothetical protein [Promicromonosporaceae bacterium]
MALIIVLMLIVGGFAAGTAHEQGWGAGVVALRGIGAALVVALLVALIMWWRMRRIKRELETPELYASE